MLLEHKLHATKLQSDVTLLTQDKVGAEEQVEALLEEISSFEEGVRTLEKEMHQLTRVEAEAAAYMDEESRYALREQKTKLDKEFGDMLGKIGNRKDMLYDLEKKLSQIDKARQVRRISTFIFQSLKIWLYLYISISYLSYLSQCSVVHWKASPYLLLPHPTVALALASIAQP